MWKCKYCKYSKIAGAWLSECTNENSEYYGEECVERLRFEKQKCDDKEIDEEGMYWGGDDE